MTAPERRKALPWNLMEMAGLGPDERHSCGESRSRGIAAGLLRRPPQQDGQAAIMDARATKIIVITTLAQATLLPAMVPIGFHLIRLSKCVAAACAVVIVYTPSIHYLP